MPWVGLTREAVIEPAMAAADANGLRAVTMRALASPLDVEAMSLYNHVANKGDLLRGIVGVVWCGLRWICRRTSPNGAPRSTGCADPPT